MFGLSPARHAHLSHPDPDLSARRPHGGRRLRWRSHRCSARRAVPSASAGPAGSGTWRRSGRHGRQRAKAERAELEAAWIMLDTGGQRAAVQLRPLSTTRCSSGCWSCWARPWPAARTGQAAARQHRRRTDRDRPEPPARRGGRRLKTPHGVFCGPDYMIEVRAAGTHRVSRASGETPVSNLSNQLVITEREELARGIRLLLASPLISERASPEGFDLVRRRREPIRQWFEYYCGWSLIVEPRLGYARLIKVRAAADPSRPARRTRSGRARVRPAPVRAAVPGCGGIAQRPGHDDRPPCGPHRPRQRH